MKCPVEKCDRECKKIETLKWHLYSEHNKQELVDAIVFLMDLAADLGEKLKNLKWQRRAHGS